MAARPLRSLCYVSLDFDAELAVTKWKGKKNLLRREFVMPDYVTHFRGQIRDPNVKPPPSAGADSTAAPPKKKEKKAGDEEQVLTVANERIAVPEVLFAPNSIGIDQAGVAETIVQSVEGCLPDMQHALYGNIVLTGGSTAFPGFAERLKRELRSMIPAEAELDVTMADDPICAAWKGGSILAAAPTYPSQLVTRAEYQEYGHALCRRRFAVAECTV